MSKNITKHILTFVLLAFIHRSEAQQWLGRTTGNYAGSYGVYHNASSLADNKYRYYFNFWGRGVNFYNNYLGYNAPVKLNHWANNQPDLAQYKDADGRIMMGDNWLEENLNGRDKQFSFNQDIFGPAFMFPVSRNWNMSVNTRQRSGLQMFGISESAARMARNGISDGQYASIGKGFSVNVQSYQELSFSLGGIMAQNDRHKLNGGISLKLIRGLGAASLKGSDLGIAGTGNNSALVSGDFSYAYTDDKAVVEPFNNPYGVFSLQSRGAGAGIDLGLTYTFRSARLKHKSAYTCDRNDLRSDYDIKLSMAFNDLGGIRYNRNSQLYKYSSIGSAGITVPSEILDGFKDPEQNAFDSIGRQVFEALGATRSSGFSTALPAAFNFQADFRFSKYFYTSVYLNQSLKGAKNSGLRATSMLSVIPRFESRSFEFSMPLTLSENYQNFYLGAYARIGPVFFGSDNLGGLLNVAASSQFTGADIYGGVSFGIGHCAGKYKNDPVDPVYADSFRKSDTLVSRFRDTVLKTDTIRIVRRDTVFLDKKTKEPIRVKRDTVYIEKIVQKPVSDLSRENELKKREEELRRRQVQLDVREKELLEKQKTGSSETGTLRECLDKNNALLSENNNLKNRISSMAIEINGLKKQVNDLNNLKTSLELSKKQCDEDKIRNNAEILRLQEELIKAKQKIGEVQTELEVLKKSQVIRNDTEMPKGSDAEKLAAARLKIDSLRIRVLVLETDLEKCRKNATANEAEILRKATAEKTKAENDARIARRQADSLSLILERKQAELDACKKNSTQNNAEILRQAENDKAKAENDARIARRQADSLSLLLERKQAELEACKNNQTQNSADALKLKNCEESNASLKAEMLEMSKTIARLNTRNYALSYKVDSLVNALKNCCLNCSTGNNSGSNDALLKECQQGKAELEAEVLRLKATISRQDKSLDSMESLYAAQVKKQTELNAQIVKLNAEIATLKTNTQTGNCDEVQKQLDDKTTELNKVKSENSALQNQVKNLNAQLSEYKTEYNFIVKQSQICNMKLDSCMRGLYNHKPAEPTEPKGDTGSNEGSNERMERGGDSDGVYSSAKSPATGLEVGAAILNVLMNSSKTKSNTGGSSTGSGSSRPTENNSGNSSTGVKRPSESGGGSSTSGSSTSGSSSSGDRGTSGTDAGSRRR